MIRAFLTLIICFLCFSVDVNASSNDLELSSFKSIPILHQGRIQPIDTVARFYFDQFSNGQKIQNQSYIKWFSNTVFNPENSIDQNIFYINHPEFFSLEKRKNKLYNYLELTTVINKKQSAIQQILEKTNEGINEQEQALITLYENYILYTQLLRSLTLFIPTDINQPSVWESKSKLSRQAKIIVNGAQSNALLRVIAADQTLQSPWQSYYQRINSEQLDQWQSLTTAYREKNGNLWDESLNGINQTSDTKIKMEVLYNKLSLLNVSFVLYILTLVGLVIYFLKPIPAIQKIIFPIFTIAIIAHSVHLILRSTILARPPVGTLYESVIFVSLTGAIICWLLYKNYKLLSLFIGAFLGAALLTTAQAFSAEEPMGTLVAVLNTNFWLATHVLCITIGYGLCLLSSTLAHIMIIQPKRFGQLLKALLIASLLFTTIGTVLGGIWADQSWGRFWGWDPKENGALLIVLWITWILHGKMSGHLKPTGYLIATAALSIIVILAWFGVNLLSVGLHSYGFISGIAWGIGLFCAAEIILIAGLYFYRTKKLVS